MSSRPGTMRVELLKTDGTREVHEIPKQGAIDRIAELIGADTTDAVNLRDGRVLIVDDLGYETETIPTQYGVEIRPVRALKPVNVKATELYWAICQPGTTHEIVGDAVIAVDQDFAP